MKELLIVRNVFEELGVTRRDLVGFFNGLQSAGSTRLVGWRVQNGQVNPPEVELPEGDQLVSFYTVSARDKAPLSAQLATHVAALKSRSYAHSMLVEQPYQPWQYVPSLITNRFARIFNVEPARLVLKFIETNVRLLLHSDAFYGKPRGSYDPNSGPPGYEGMHESNMLEASVNWTVRGHEVPLMVRGKKKFVSNEGELDLPVAFNPKELHGTQADTDRLTCCIRPRGLTYEQVRERLEQGGLIKEVRS